MNQEENKTPAFFRFEDLRIYNKAVDFVAWLTNISTNFSTESDQYFFQKFIDEATNAALNIAEGSARNKPLFVNQLKEAKGNIRKAVVFTTIGLRRGVITAEQEQEIRTQLMEMTKMVGALITSLQRNSNNNNTQRDNQFDDEFDTDNLTW